MNLELFVIDGEPYVHAGQLAEALVNSVNELEQEQPEVAKWIPTFAAHLIEAIEAGMTELEQSDGTS